MATQDTAAYPRATDVPADNAIRRESAFSTHVTAVLCASEHLSTLISAKGRNRPSRLCRDPLRATAAFGSQCGLLEKAKTIPPLTQLRPFGIRQVERPSWVHSGNGGGIGKAPPVAAYALLSTITKKP
jgi:hypothetical protein